MRITSNRLCTAVAAAMLVSTPLSHAQLEEVIVTASKIESSMYEWCTLARCPRRSWVCALTRTGAMLVLVVELSAAEGEVGMG